MLKRDSRNIGKRVRINKPGTYWHGREGIVKSFRAGDRAKGDPYVMVSYKGGTYPFPGSTLEVIEDNDNERRMHTICICRTKFTT